MDELTGSSVAAFWDQVYSTVPAGAALVVGGLDLGPADNDPLQAGARVLICACGTGEHVVRAVKAGCSVTAVDISAEGVRRAQQVCSSNGVGANFLVADLASTGLPTQSIDLAWGSAVLHHLDHDLFSAELERILSPGGRAIFVSEPTFFNPLFRLAYEFCFGRGRSNRRRKFLFIRRRGDDFEKPLDNADLDHYRRTFDVSVSPRSLMFFQKVSHVAFRSKRVDRALTRLDQWLDQSLPQLRRFGYEYDVTITRRSSS